MIRQLFVRTLSYCEICTGVMFSRGTGSKSQRGPRKTHFPYNVSLPDSPSILSPLESGCAIKSFENSIDYFVPKLVLLLFTLVSKYNVFNRLSLCKYWQ